MFFILISLYLCSFIINFTIHEMKNGIAPLIDDQVTSRSYLYLFLLWLTAFKLHLISEENRKLILNDINRRLDAAEVSLKEMQREASIDLLSCAAYWQIANFFSWLWNLIKSLHNSLLFHNSDMHLGYTSPWKDHSPALKKCKAWAWSCQVTWHFTDELRINLLMIVLDLLQIIGAF